MRGAGARLWTVGGEPGPQPTRVSCAQPPAICGCAFPFRPFPTRCATSRSTIGAAATAADSGTGTTVPSG